MHLHVRAAEPEDVALVSEILVEAASWLEHRAIPLWPRTALSEETIRPHVLSGYYFLAVDNGVAVATFRLTTQDPMFWPEAEPGEALYLHRMAVRRAYAGGRISGELLDWVVNYAEARGYAWVRLDCEASRSRLRAIYERFGFVYHSDQEVGPFLLARYQYQVPRPAA